MHTPRSQNIIRLFVVEDHISLVSGSLRYNFRPERDGIMVTGFATTIEDTLQTAKPDLFDLFILDLHLPGHLPIQNIRKLKEYFPGKPIVIYTSETATSWKNRMMDEGAAAYITKDSGREELKLAFQKAARGEVFFYRVEGLKEDDADRVSISSKAADMAPMQFEVITLLAEGLIHKEIAERLGISKSMIEKLLKNLRKSFNAKNNIELAKLLTHLGIIK